MKRAAAAPRNWKGLDGRHAASFLSHLRDIQSDFQVTNARRATLTLNQGMIEALALVTRAAASGGKLIFIGNGGSAAIASHQAVDYWKNGGIPSIAFNDASLLTCIGNDCGFENLFSEPVKCFAGKKDLLIAISSSGRSPNILNGTKVARKIGCRVLTFSGFSPSNALRRLGDVNFYVPSEAYGIVEVSHLSLIHALLREIIYINPKANKKGY